MTKRRGWLVALSIVLFAICLTSIYIAPMLIDHLMPYAPQIVLPISSRIQTTSLEQPAQPGTVLQFRWGTISVVAYGIDRQMETNNIDGVGKDETVLAIVIRLICRRSICKFEGHRQVSVVGAQGIIYQPWNIPKQYLPPDRPDIYHSVTFPENVAITSFLVFKVQKIDRNFIVVILTPDKVAYLALKDGDPGTAPTYQAMVDALQTLTPAP